MHGSYQMRSIPRLCCITCLVAFLGLPGCTNGWHLTRDDPQLPAKRPEYDQVAETHTDKQSRSLKTTRMSEWDCEIPDSLLVEFPCSIDNDQQWRPVWEVCHSGRPLPLVDFEKNVIRLEFWDAADSNDHGSYFYPNPDGSIHSTSASTLIGFEPSNNTKIEFYVVSRN